MSLSSTCKSLLTLLTAVIIGASVCFASQVAFANELGASSAKGLIDYDDADKVIDFATVEQENVSDNAINLMIKNTGEFQISNWSVVFNADFKVFSIKGANLVSAENAVQFKYLKRNAIIAPGESVLVKLSVGKGSKFIERFRVYGLCPELSEDHVVNDCISYDCDTGEERLMCSDEEEYLFPEDSTEADLERNIGGFGNYALIPPDNRVQIRNVNNIPYQSIGLLISSVKGFSDGIGTAFMIGNRHALTSAHCVCKVSDDHRIFKMTSARLYFGVSGSLYRKKVTTSALRYSSAYRVNPTAVNDWACLIFKRNVNRGYFFVGYASPTLLKSMYFTVAGYPGDQAEPSWLSPMSGRAWFMFACTGKLKNVNKFSLSYTMDANHGQSGSPVFNSRYFVYGIHSRGTVSGNANLACYLTPGRVNYFRKMRWCGPLD